jgi:ubiquinone biosynthesis protein
MESALEGIDISGFVPAEYAAYRPLVKEALQYFLSRLSARRRAALWEAQLKLGPNADLEDRLYAVLRRCPSLHKLGQVLARESTLAPGLRRRLQRLETLRSDVSREHAEALVRDEIGERGDVVLHGRPLAEASVALIVPFSYRPGEGRKQDKGVFKVLKPGVREALDEDLQIWAELGGILEERCREYGLPAARYRDAVDRMRGLLASEVQLDREQESLSRAARFYADDPAVAVPGLFPFCTPRLTAMEFLPGRKITDAGLAGVSGRRIGEKLIDSLIAKPVWTDADRTPVHGDLHSGNLLLTPDGRVGILDWSLATSLSRTLRASLVQIVLGAATMDEQRVCEGLQGVAQGPAGCAGLGEVIEEGLRQVLRGAFPGFDWLVRFLDRAAVHASLQFPEPLMAFRKSVFSLSGVLAEICSRCSVDEVMLRSGWRQLLSEWPKRLLEPSVSRNFGTHVSTADLFSLWTGAPAAAFRLWNAQWRESSGAGG